MENEELKTELTNYHCKKEVEFKRGLSWKKSELHIEDMGYRITNIGDENISKKKLYMLKNAKVIQSRNDLEFTISHPDEVKNMIKVETIEEKNEIVGNLKKIIYTITKAHAFSQEYLINEQEIQNLASCLGKDFDAKKQILKRLQNLLWELTQKIEEISNYIFELEFKNPTSKEFLLTSSSSMIIIKDEIMKQLDQLTIETNSSNSRKNSNADNLGVPKETENAQNKTEEDTKTVKFEETKKEEEKKENLNEAKKEENNNPENKDSANKDNLKIENTPEEEKKEEQPIKKPAIIKIGGTSGTFQLRKDFRLNRKTVRSRTDGIEENKIKNTLIEFKKVKSSDIRTTLPKRIKYVPGYAKEAAKILAGQRVFIPLSSCEPLTKLQKECEKFVYSYLLDKAAETNNKALRLCYISVFALANLSLQINRFYPPINPILGETYEYIDNFRGYRYISEHVSRDPSISAFFCENNNWAFFGDTHCIGDLNIFGRQLLIKFETKYHFTIKKDGDYYLISKPPLGCKGLLIGDSFFKFKEGFTVSNANDPNIKAEIELIRQAKANNQIGNFEGKIYSNGQVAYLIKGNWKSYAYYCDPNGNNKQHIWEIIDDKYLTNNAEAEQYYIPNFSVNLNNLTQELAEFIPPTDSRLREDVSLCEEGNFEDAEKVRAQYEKNEEKRSTELVNENILYQPNYFSHVFDQNSKEYTYIYQGSYWEDRAKMNFDHLDEDFFKLE